MCELDFCLLFFISVCIGLKKNLHLLQEMHTQHTEKFKAWARIYSDYVVGSFLTRKSFKVNVFAIVTRYCRLCISKKTMWMS